MKLFQAKTVGHRSLRDSGWYSMFKELTVIEGRPGLGKTTMLRTLQAINPASGESNLDPFHDYPREVKKSGHRRRVIAAKKTGVFAIFICNEKLRRQLTPVDPVFYETDRIEVGRRLDWSRWINFVEIAASSRWSEVAPDLDRLRGLLAENSDTAPLLREYENFRETGPTDRVKKELADRLNTWLDKVEPCIPAEGRKTLDKARFKVDRAVRFKKARQVTAANLPVFIYFNDSMLITAASNHIHRYLNLPPEFPRGTGLPARMDEQVNLRLAELSDLINTVRPGENISLRLDNGREGRKLLVATTGASPRPLEEARPDLIWLISLLIHFRNSAGTRIDKAVLLLDEPGVFWSPARRKMLRPAIEELASMTQTIVTCQPENSMWHGARANHFSLIEKNGQSELTKSPD